MSKSKHELPQFDKLNRDDSIYQYFLVENDPLTYEQKNKIIDFTYQFLYATQKQNPGLICFAELSIRASELYLAFTKTKPYQALTDQQIRGLAKAADALPYSPISLGENDSFELFYDILTNPAQHATTLGIDATQFSQTYATSILIHAVFNSNIWVTEPGAYVSSSNPYLNAFAQYRHELCDNNISHCQTGQTITGKHELLMRGDPVQRILENNSQPTPLDFLLARTYFTAGKWSKLSGYAFEIDKHGNSIDDGQTFIYTEEYRGIIRTKLKSLYEHPDLHHVIAAFGVLSKQHNKYLLFASTPFSVGKLGKIHKLGLGHLGFYDHSDAIVSAGIVQPSTLTVDKNNVGTVVHEALHLIFDLLIKNASSPVNTPGDAQTLDQAILADQQHRQALDQAALNNDEKEVWRTVVDDLENEKSYFSGCTTEETKQNIMRIEVIVRPMERLAAGNSEASVRKVMPHVWQFYRQHCRPMIEEYLRQQGHHDRITLDISKYEALTETQPAQNQASLRRMNLNLHKAHSNLIQLLGKINTLSQDEELISIKSALMAYYGKLNQAQVDFFKNPQGDSFDIFNNICQEANQEIDAQLQAKSSVWHDRVYPIIKQISGCILGIAATLISCGIFPVVMYFSPKIQKKYQDTFFKEPATKKITQSVQEIKEIVDELGKHQPK